MASLHTNKQDKTENDPCKIEQDTKDELQTISFHLILRAKDKILTKSISRDKRVI